MPKEMGIHKKIQHIHTLSSKAIMLMERGIHKKGAAYIHPIQCDNYTQEEGNI